MRGRRTETTFTAVGRMLGASLGLMLLAGGLPSMAQQLQPLVPKERRGQVNAEREGTHDANSIRTVFLNYGMVGDFEGNPDLSVFHSVEVPKGSGLNYSDGITPFVLGRIVQNSGTPAYIMETGYRERQGTSPVTGKTMRFEPRFGYFETDPAINTGRSIAISNDPRTWPGGARSQDGAVLDPSECWIDKVDDPDDPGWCGDWNGFFGKRPNADQESFFVMDDDFYDAWDFFPDSRDAGLPASDRRRGLGLRVEVRGFQWSNPQASNVIFWHYDIVNEGTTDYEDIIFGIYMDSGVGGSSVSCDGYGETDDDNAFYTTEFGQDLVYTWDQRNTGVSLSSNCARTGYLGYAYLETPGNPFNNMDDDDDGIIDERRESGPGQEIVGQEAIRAHASANYDMAMFERAYGPLEERPAYVAGVWWTGDEDMDWVAELHDTGADGVFATETNPADTGELDGIPTEGETNYDRTDINESDQIGLTGFKLNRIRPGPGASGDVDAIVFNTTGAQWPRRLYEQFSDPVEANRFDDALVENYNIGFLFASGPFRLPAGTRQRFSLALAYGDDLQQLEDNVETVQQIYDANYQFAVPPPEPTVQAYVNPEGHVVLNWTNVSEKAVDPVTNLNDFEGYKVYRSTDPTFLDPRRIVNARGISPFPIGAPLETFDLENGIAGYSDITVQGVSYYLGEETGLKHTFVDTTVTLGQTYYYAVTAYDHGSPELGFFPSENAVSVSRTPRGGIVLPPNVVEVRPNLPAPGYTPAAFNEESLQHVTGNGTATVGVRIVNDARVPNDHTFRIDFAGSADSVRAETYSLTDVTSDEVLFTGATAMRGRPEEGPVGKGVQPVIDTPVGVSFDSAATGFTSGGANIAFQARYSEVLPANLRRPGYPENLIITFADQPLDTTLAAIGVPAIPVNFKIEGEDSGLQLNFRFRDVDGDATIGKPDEFIEIVTYTPDRPTSARPTWNVSIDTTRVDGVIEAPGAGDVLRLVFRQPLDPEDAYTFTVRGSRFEEEKARREFAEFEPYVVPNPYVAAASFEPERFATSGRGVRRIEFRGVPLESTVHIYTVRGELVQTLEHDGITRNPDGSLASGEITGMIPWDLRTKDNLDVAPGLYIFHVTSDIGETTGKFAIIK